jgi:hypothetical protein
MALADQQRSEPSPLGRDAQATDENIFRRGERGLEELNALLNRYENLSRVGGAGVNVLGQALIARRANRKREAQAAAERARAVPFRQAEAEAMARARGGGLTPQNARRLEAAAGPCSSRLECWKPRCGQCCCWNLGWSRTAYP